MTCITLTCPTCGHSGALDEAAVPIGPVTFKCPRCLGTFAFEKGTGISPMRWGGSAPPPPQAPRPKRSRRKILAAIGAVACAVVVGAAAWMSVFKLTPIVTAKLPIAALFSKVPPVERVAIKAARTPPLPFGAGIFPRLVRSPRDRRRSACEQVPGPHRRRRGLPIRPAPFRNGNIGSC